MSVFDRNKQGRAGNTTSRYDTWVLKQRIRFSLRFSNKVKIVVNDENRFSVAAIQEWAEKEGFSCEITDGHQDVYIYGHHSSGGLHLHRPCTILYLSRKAA